MMLAQIENVPAEAVKNAVLILAGIAAIIYYLQQTFFPRRMTPPALLVEGVEKPVSEKACVTRHQQSDAKVEALEDQLKDMGTDRKRDMNQLHDKINSVDRKVAGLEAANNLQNQELKAIGAKLDRIIERGLH